MVCGVTIEIGNRKFLVNLIVLPGLGLDVIMGMSWMQRWGVVVDTASRTLSLNEPECGGTFQVLLP
jgi:predicted aspartyl protease